jgi:RHS repeat-associated protein
MLLASNEEEPEKNDHNLQNGAWGEARDGNTLGRASPFGFTGRWGGYTDARLGWVLNWNRWYGPEAGRWGSRDFIGIAGGFNLANYTQNSPLLYVDPSGFIKGDKTYGYPKDFWNWEHRRKEQAGEPDLSAEEAKAEYEEWKREGKPKTKDDRRNPGKKSKQCTVYPTPFSDFMTKTLADLMAQGMTLQQALQHLLDKPVNLPPQPNPPNGRPGSNILGHPAINGGPSLFPFPPLLMVP